MKIYIIFPPLNVEIYCLIHKLCNSFSFKKKQKQNKTPNVNMTISKVQVLQVFRNNNSETYILFQRTSTRRKKTMKGATTFHKTKIYAKFG